MKAIIKIKGKSYEVGLARPLDISLPLRGDKKNVRAWHVGIPKIEPVSTGRKIFEVRHGAPVNFRNISFNPHGHGTHTECVGHITRKDISLYECFSEFFMPAILISVKPEKQKNNDRVITTGQIESALKGQTAAAIIIRTLPNGPSKKSFCYSGTNPAYLHHEAAAWLRNRGFRHLLIDLPSVDRENDNGLLLSHHAFWNHPQKTRKDCTITELIYAKNSIKDGMYFLNLVPASIINDAAPVRAVLYAMKPVKGK
jgi:kynurenine formamidase